MKIGEKPLTITDFTRLLNEAVDNSKVKKISYKTILSWLSDHGYINLDESYGYKLRKPTEKGRRIGIYLEQRVSSTGEMHYVTLYSSAAQKHILEIINEIALYK